MTDHVRKTGASTLSSLAEDQRGSFYIGESLWREWILKLCLAAPYSEIQKEVPIVERVGAADLADRLYIKRIVSTIFEKLISSASAPIFRGSKKRNKKQKKTASEHHKRMEYSLLRVGCFQRIMGLREKQLQLQLEREHRPVRLAFSFERPTRATREARKAERRFKNQRPHNKPRGYVEPKIRISYQSQEPTDAQRRFHREVCQRLAAAEKKAAEKRKVPKLERLIAIKQQRDKRNPAEYQSGLRPSIVGAGVFGLPKEACKPPRPSKARVELQSGLPIALAASYGVLKLCGGLFRCVSRISKAAEKSTDLMSELQKKLNGFAAEFKKIVGTTFWTLPLIMTLYFCVKRCVSMGQIFPLVVSAALARIVGPALWSRCSEFFQDRTVELQSGVDQLFDAAPKLFATVFCFSALRGRRATAVSDFCRRISMLDRMALGWETFLSWFGTAFEKAVNWFRSLFGKEKCVLMRQQHAALNKWKVEVDDILQSCCTGGDISANDLTHMCDVIRRGFEFKHAYAGTIMARSVEDYLAKAAAALQPYEGALKARNNFRFEPSMFMAYGGPGVGKTLMAMPLCITILKLSGIVPETSNFEQTVNQIWQKGNSEYWNGYAGQECLVMDDCFQAKADKTNMENDYMNIIRIVSSWSFPLNFADLASKGKIYFGSKFVFATTNLPTVYSEALNVIQEPDAVVRRISHPYKISVAAPYALDDGKLNYPAFAAALNTCMSQNVGIDRYPWFVWEVSRHDFLTGGTYPERVPLREIILRVADELKQKFVLHTQQCDFLRGFTDNFTVELQSGAKHDQQACWPSEEEQKTDLKDHDEVSAIVLKTLRVFASAIGLVVLIKLLKEAMKFSFGILGALFNFVFRRGDKKKKQLQSNVPRADRRPQSIKANSPKLQGYDDAIASNMYSNSYKFYGRLETGGAIVFGQILFIKDRLAIMPAHFTKDIQRLVKEGSLAEGQSLYFRHCTNASFEYALSPLEFLSMPRSTLQEAEVEFISMNHGRAHRNVTSNFVKEADLRYMGGHPVRLDVCNVEARGSLGKDVQRKVFISSSLQMGNKLAVAGQQVNRYVRYDASTEPGDCGAPLCVLDPSRFSGRVCIGVHFAGSTDRCYGYSTIVTQEMVSKAVDQLGIVEDKFEEDLRLRGVVLNSSHILPFDNSGSFLPLYTVDKPVNISPKTSYFVTSYFGSLGEYACSPAPLSPVIRDGKLIYPMVNAVAAYSSPLRVYEHAFLEQAVHVALQPLTALTRDRARCIYTFEEAVLGIPEEKFRSIPRATSPGYPYVLTMRNGKKQLFGEEEDYDLCGKEAAELRERVDYIVKCARDNVRLSVVYVDFLKDELRSQEKVDKVATRLISSAPVDYVVAWRMYFGAFSAATMSMSVKSGMAPGVNVYADAGSMAEKMMVKGQYVFDGDFKQFDASEQPSIHNRVLDYINKWYDDGVDNARVRRVLWMDLVHSRHLGGTGFDQRHIYQWNKSLPSGHPFTTIINSIYSLVMLVSAYIDITGDWSGFWGNVSALTYGDDNMVNVCDRVKEVYNQETVSGVLYKLFGVCYTAGDKQAGFHSDTSISDVSFLKRSFRLEDKRWLCPLALDSFLYVAYWCKNARLMRTILRDNWENALEELSLHDERLWVEFAPRIIDMLCDGGNVTRFVPTRSAYQAAVLRRTDDWY